MAKVIMTAAQLVERLKTLAARKTFYKNKYPYNLCYIHADGRTSADCVNLYKALLNGYDVNNTTVGYFQKNLSNTGDCTEWGLMKQCSEISGDFSNMGNKPRLLYMSGHIGGYLGEEVTIGGKVYNCIECTGAWGGGILYSYIEADGTRKHYRGGSANGKWSKNGLMTPWVDYSVLSSDHNSTPEAEKPKEQNDKPAGGSKKTAVELAAEIKAGKWGNEPQRSAKLTAAGYSKEEIRAAQNIINAEAKKPTTTAPVYYTVRKNDTLSGIAKKYGTTVHQIAQWNHIKNVNFIKAGDSLRVK